MWQKLSVLVSRASKPNTVFKLQSHQYKGTGHFLSPAGHAVSDVLILKARNHIHNFTKGSSVFTEYFRDSVHVLILWIDFWKVLYNLFWHMLSWGYHKKYNDLLCITGWNTDKSYFSSWLDILWGNKSTGKETIPFRRAKEIKLQLEFKPNRSRWSTFWLAQAIEWRGIYTSNKTLKFFFLLLKHQRGQQTHKTIVIFDLVFV